MSFVLDASVTACWCFPDERFAVADAAMQRLIDEEALVPPLWALEIRNILVLNEGLLIGHPRGLIFESTRKRCYY